MKEINASPKRSPLPVCVVTGFLGAGKTSLLNHFLSSDHGLRIGVLVNDFGAIDIDSQLVESVTEDTVSLRNGCICCTMRDDFYAAVIQLVLKDDPPQALVIETSGVSDPSTVVATLTHPSLTKEVRVDSVVSVIDCDSFHGLGKEELRLAEAQASMADLIVLNKTDLADEEKLKHLEKAIRKMAPLARFFHTVHGRVPIAALLSWDSLGDDGCRAGQSTRPNFLGAPILKISSARPTESSNPLSPHAVHHHSHEDCCDGHHHHHGGEASLSDAFESVSFVVDPPLSLDKVRNAIMDLPLSIYRLKGLFHVDANPDKQLLIQVVGPRISAAEVKPWGDKKRRSEIVAIGLKGSVDEAHLKEVFESCIATSSGGFFGGLKEKAAFWRRGDSSAVGKNE